ncbi:Glycoprotein-N-acetylgalactosamine 3-beta-galactosyltransferase 1 [Phytophthora citrophthora]|uniref:N-acetylgalactosaminide beta-1,3-galactosyltransferase n=1 Tax=Phytophthora citrophthora TaxID=4793 RepID=A0AAD9GNH2_9STRA|nr:Glycoprotein-N-acetylgalactosamine 3-beta-galactosyltransferase 1 [Phytophthora citrophthora]
MWLLLFALWVFPAVSSHRPELLEALGDNVPAMELVNLSPVSPEASKTRVLCWVNTYHANHEKRLHSIKKTWGKKCDKLLFMSDIEDLTVPTVEIVAPPLHEMLWQKHREIVRLLVREYGEDHFDWVFKCDDDTFLLMENLKMYLNSPEIRAISEEPTILGHRMTLQWWEMQRLFEPFEDHDPEHVAAMLKVRKETRDDGGLLYTPGGGGYAMNWAYLKKLEAAFDEPYCLPNEVVPDDWAISFCMRHLGVIPLDTRDAEKRERFHQYDPNDLYTRPYDLEAYDHNLFTSIYQENNWFSDHNGIGWQNGKNCCAPDTISFHYVKPPLMELFYEYYYGEQIPVKT